MRQVTEANQLELDRTLVLDVMCGAVTEDSHPALFDEDVVLFAVRRMEASDPDWLLARIADESLPRAGRQQVAGDTDVLSQACFQILED